MTITNHFTLTMRTQVKTVNLDRKDEDIRSKTTMMQINGKSRGISLKLALKKFAQIDSKCRFPKRRSLSTEEFIQHFLNNMDICDVTSRIRMKELPFALYYDAIDEFKQNIRKRFAQEGSRERKVSF